jgi:organic radical activating enzyme
MCHRCWSEEEIGHTSERQYLIQDIDPAINYTDPGFYQQGPKHLNIKVSNICNLRCRTCQSYDSYLYHIEGEYYEQKYNLKNTPYNAEKIKKHFTDSQLDELYELSNNLERIELYGGEPFLDEQIPKFLTKLVSHGLSKNIDLFVSTNATHQLTDYWRNILVNFKRVIINLSIDGIDDRFTYMRHPGKWDIAEKNIKILDKLTQEYSSINIVPVITVSALNVWYINEVFEYFKQYNTDPFLILVQWPSYYCVNVLPESIKPLVEQRLKSFDSTKFTSLISLMYTEPTKFSDFKDMTPWDEFKFWTKEKDMYRNENFITTFDEFGKLLLEKNEWD